VGGQVGGQAGGQQLPVARPAASAMPMDPSTSDAAAATSASSNLGPSSTSSSLPSSTLRSSTLQSSALQSSALTLLRSSSTDGLMRGRTAPYTHTSTSASASAAAFTYESSTVASPMDPHTGSTREADLLLEALREKLVASHSSIILAIEDALAQSTPSDASRSSRQLKMSEPVRAQLQHQLLTARRALQETHALRQLIAPAATMRSFPPGSSTSASTSPPLVGAAPLMRGGVLAEESSSGRRASSTWNSLPLRSDVGEPRARTSREQNGQRAHYSQTMQRFSRSSSDASMFSKDSRKHSLTTMLRRLFLGPHT